MRADDSHVERAKLRPKEERARETPTAQREEEERPGHRKCPTGKQSQDSIAPASQTVQRARVRFPTLCQTILS